MNHVPDDALAAVDAFGRGLLEGDPPPVDERLRGDLRLGIRSAQEGVVCRYRIDGGPAPTTLRDRGSFVTTIVDAVDDRLRSWGIHPPAAYEYAETVDGVHQYEGPLDV